ncbi:MAG: phosphoserine phosphatase SerB [Micavibrio sp.]|nr:phosphoserine phosphatase SerB [Micavibrio sp.]
MVYQLKLISSGGNDALKSAISAVNSVVSADFKQGAQSAVATFDDVPSIKTLTQIRQKLQGLKVDILCVPTGFRPKIAFFDMDSTIVDAETLDEMAVYAGVGEEVAAITRQAMAEGLDFDWSLRTRLAKLKGVDAGSLCAPVYAGMKFNPGAEELISGLKAAGVKCVLVSGGFTYFTEKVAASLGMDAHHGNELEIVDGKLTGAVTNDADILNGAKKALHLADYAKKMGCEPVECYAMGDGSNDIAMMQVAGLGVGYKPALGGKVEREIPNIIRHGNLATALHAFDLS